MSAPSGEKLRSVSSNVGKVSFEKLGIANINDFKDNEPTHTHHDGTGHELGAPLLTKDEREA